MSSKRSANTETRHDVNAAVRAGKALSMRQLGYTYERIAEQCGYKDRGAAFHAVQRELKRTITPIAEDVRELELTRLDQLLTVFYAKALKGDGWAMDRVLRIMERRTAYLGLDTVQTGATLTPLIVEVPQSLAAALRGHRAAAPVMEVASGSSD